MSTQVASSKPLDEALEQLFETADFYGPGLANHGPMAAEALENLGHPEALDAFLADYSRRLDPARHDVADLASPGDDWPTFVRTHGSRLAPSAGSLAGHGLLRMAHAVRALERFDTPTRRIDLAVSERYWSAGQPITTPAPRGQLSLVDAVAELPRLAHEQTPGPIHQPLVNVSRDPQVIAVLASIAPPDDPQHRLDELALASVDRYLANGDRYSFTFMHGVTVSTMAAVLLPYLDADAQRSLVTAVQSFVLLAVVAFDRIPGAPGSVTDVARPEVLAIAAAASADDHTIKFTDACLTLARRTGSEAPLAVAEIRCRATA